MDQLLLRPEEVAKCLNIGRSKVYELNARRHARVGPHRNLPPSHPGRSRAVRRLTTIRDGHLVSIPCHGALCSSPAAVVVELGGSVSMYVCRGHLRQVMHEQGILVAAFHRIDWHPRCCQDGCSRMAENRIIDVHDLTRPLCRRHLADLGRFEPPNTSMGPIELADVAESRRRSYGEGAIYQLADGRVAGLGRARVELRSTTTQDHHPAPQGRRGSRAPRTPYRGRGWPTAPGPLTHPRSVDGHLPARGRRRPGAPGHPGRIPTVDPSAHHSRARTAPTRSAAPPARRSPVPKAGHHPGPDQCSTRSCSSPPALTVAVRWGLLSTNPALMVDAPAMTRAEIVPYTVAEARPLLDAASGNRLEARWVLALTLAYDKARSSGSVGNTSTPTADS